MGKLTGIRVILFEKVEVGRDGFDHPIYEETAKPVDNVLVVPATTTEIVDTMNLTGKKAVYSIALPKGDCNEWENNRIEFFGESWKVIGLPQQGIEANIPLRWNKKWMVERYE